MNEGGWWGCYGDARGAPRGLRFPCSGPRIRALRPAAMIKNNKLRKLELAPVVPELRLVRIVEARQRGHVGAVVFFDVGTRRLRDPGVSRVRRRPCAARRRRAAAEGTTSAGQKTGMMKPNLIKVNSQTRRRAAPANWYTFR